MVIGRLLLLVLPLLFWLLPLLFWLLPLLFWLLLLLFWLSFRAQRVNLLSPVLCSYRPKNI